MIRLISGVFLMPGLVYARAAVRLAPLPRLHTVSPPRKFLEVTTRTTCSDRGKHPGFAYKAFQHTASSTQDLPALLILKPPRGPLVQDGWWRRHDADKTCPQGDAP